MIKIKKIFIILLFFSNYLFAQTIESLTNYSFENIVEDNEANYKILEWCISLYLAVTELAIERYPDLGNQFSEIAETLNPCGIIALSKTQGKTYEEAEYIFFNNVSNLRDQYIDEKQRKSKAAEEIRKLSEQILIELK